MDNRELEKTTVQQIVSLHNQIISDLKRSLDSAIKIGHLLTEQKASLKHGEFGPWVKSNLPFTDRTARNYMRLHREKDRLKTETVSDLKSAYRVLTAPKEELNWVYEMLHCYANCVNCAKEDRPCSWREAFEATHRGIEADEHGPGITLNDLMTYHVYFFDIVTNDCIPRPMSHINPTEINIAVDGIIEDYRNSRMAA
jgi:hypothetical protein